MCNEMCRAIAQLLADRFGTRVFVEFERGLHNEPHRVEDTWVAPEKPK